MPPRGGVTGDIPASASAPPSPDSSATALTDSASATPLSYDSSASLSPEASEVFRILTTNGGIELEENGSEENLSTRLPGYQRIVFPREQNLLDLLRLASGTHCVSRLREVRLRVVAADVSLSRLGSCAPRLRTLTLDGSGLTSLREIGTDLKYLTVLCVARCGLTSLDGTFGLTTLRELHAADNEITNVGPCAALENIRIINLDRNPINSLHNVGLLSFCPRLVKLSLRGAPVGRQLRYRETLLTLLPNLKRLDGNTLDGNDSLEYILEGDTNYESADFDPAKEELYSESESTSCSIEVSSMTEASSPSPGQWREIMEYNDSTEVADHSNSLDEVQNTIYTDTWKLSKKNNRLFCEIACSNIARTSKSSCQHFTQRPSTALGLQSSAQLAKPVLANRPTTAIPVKPPALPISDASMSCVSGASRLTSGAVVCGNIGRALASARARERTIKSPRPRGPDAWLIGPPSCNTYYVKEDMLCSTNCKNIKREDYDELRTHRRPCLENAKRILDEPLPHKPAESTPFVELEFGVTGLIDSLQRDTLTNREDISEDALKAAGLWRKAFKLYRKHNK